MSKDGVFSSSDVILLRNYVVKNSGQIYTKFDSPASLRSILLTGSCFKRSYTVDTDAIEIITNEQKLER